MAVLARVLMKAPVSPCLLCVNDAPRKMLLYSGEFGWATQVHLCLDFRVEDEIANFPRL